MDNWEKSFIKAHTDTLATLPVIYGDDYEQPPSNLPRRVPTLPIDLAPPPPPKSLKDSSSASVTLKFKSLKPAATFTLAVSPTDTILAIKHLLAAKPGAPAPEGQRLLHKGKALADSKLLKEYPIADGDTVNLMIKPGFEPPVSSSTPSTVPSPRIVTAPSVVAPNPSALAAPASSTTLANLTASPSNLSRSRSHSRTGSANIPDLVLSPIPSPSASTPGTANKDPLPSIPLNLDTADAHPPSLTSVTAYHASISTPAFWARLYAFLKKEFSSPEDAAIAFEDFLRATKGQLSPGEIAKIRDEVGVFGMSGT
ncbi:ubiquitin-domain-containing protein [Sistotremastrum suecicum HHB10207 ss-3]|uniref:Ubiquitin-domain-containing protein n=1 Tax=Sistotremastrum suecicum HHB10207 ss-3 TaxID=1314776 RepID=A0A166CHV2_9AGAM|nr:ubiquitin-domain-containing protein [Sistotremastrum suecicum HHB10207 ss-3]